MSTLSGYAGSEKTLSGIISGNFDSASATSLSVSDLSVETLSSTSLTSSDASITGSLSVGNDVTVSDAITCASLTASGTIAGSSANLSSATVSGTTSTNTLSCTGTANLATVSITGTTTIYRPLSSVASVTLTGTTSLATTTCSGNITQTGGTTSLRDTTTTNLTSTGTITGTLATTSQPNITSLGTLTSLTCSGNISQTGGTTSLRTSTVTLSGASDVFTIQNTTAHPTISLSGTSTQHGYIGFYDNLGATKGSVYASSSKNAVVIDVASLTSGFLVQKSGTTKMTLTPDGNLLTTGTIACDGGFISYGSDSYLQNTTITGTVDVTPSTPNTTAIQVNTGNINLTTGNTYRINNTSVLSATALGSGVTSSSLTSVGTLSSLTVSGNTTLSGNSARFTMTGTDPRIGIGVSSPSYGIDCAGGINISSGSVFRVNGIPVMAGATDGSSIPGSLTVTGITTINNRITATSYIGTTAGSITDTTTLAQGAYLAWNYSSGGGETNFITKSGSGSGGFAFYNSTGNGSTFATGRTLLARIDNSGYMYYNRASIRVQRSGSWSVTSGENILKGGTVSFERSPGGGGYNSTNGIYTVPVAGVWTFNIYARWSDAAGALAFKPATTSAFSISNSDNSFWVPADGSGNRRTMMWSETLYMGSGVGYLCYSGNSGNMVEFIFSGNYVSN